MFLYLKDHVRTSLKVVRLIEYGHFRHCPKYGLKFYYILKKNEKGSTYI